MKFQFRKDQIYISKDLTRAYVYMFFSKKVSKSHYSMKNEYYISDSQNFLSNETSLKMAKEVS